MPIQKKIRTRADGRKLYLSDMGAGGGLVLQESSESEEELPAPPPAHGSVFAGILQEVNTGPRDTSSSSLADTQSNAVSSSNPKQKPVATTNVRGRLGDRNRKAQKSIEKVREGFVRTTAPICKKQHKVLVCQWLLSDPTNRKGEWSLEVVDFRRTMWLDDFGMQEHKQCRVGGMPELLNQLAMAMMNRLNDPAFARIAPEPSHHKTRSRKDEFDSRPLPPLARIERELRSLAVYVMADISAGANDGDEDKSNRKREAAEKPNKLDNVSLKKPENAARKEAELAVLKEKMKAQGKRREDDATRVKKTSALVPQKRARDDDVKGSKAKSRKAAAAKTATIELTDAEKKMSRSIRAAEQKDRKRQEKEEQEVEEQQQGLTAQQEDVVREESSDDGLSAAVLEALDNAASGPEAPKKKLAKAARNAKPIVETVVDDTVLKVRKRRLRPRAHVRSVIEDSSDSDSVKPPRPSEVGTSDTKARIKSKTKLETKPTIRKPTVRFADHLAAKKAARDGEFGAKAPTQPGEPSDQSKANKMLKKKEAKTARTKAKTALASEESTAASYLEDETTGDVRFLSDNVHSENTSIETTESTPRKVPIESNSDVQATKTTTASVKGQHKNNSLAHTDLPSPIAANPSLPSKKRTQHNPHSLATSLAAPANHIPDNSPSPFPDHELHDSVNTSLTAPGIAIVLTPPQPSTQSPTPHKKRTSPEPDSPASDCHLNKKRRTILDPSLAPEGDAPPSPVSTEMRT